MICFFSSYRFTGPAYAYKSALFGEGSGPMILGNVHCKGDENNIADCQSRMLDDVHCSHSQDASVSCGELQLLLG